MPDNSDRKEEDKRSNTSDAAEQDKELQPVVAGLRASEICCKCGLNHRGKVSVCQADVAENTPLLPGRRKDTWSEFEDDVDNTVEYQLDSMKSSKFMDGEEMNAALTDLADLSNIEDQSAEDLVGHTLVNKYALLSLIGKGGMSAVFRAKDLKLNKMLAVKLMLPHLASQTINARRFQIEAQAASSLYHPNLITTHDYGVTERGMPYIAMDLVEGKSLSEIVKKEGALPVKRAIPIFIQICDALAHAHGKKVLHRDLKPSNVMVTSTASQYDFVRLVDFGIAKVLPGGEEKSAEADLTRTGEIFGSPQYMSPEQCTSAALDARSDIYAMGCLMYETLAGTPPFTSDNVMEVLFAQMNDAPPGFKEIDQELEIPQSLQAIVFRCLAKNPADRYQSASELAEDLNKFDQTATDIFIRKVQAKWQVFKLKQRPLKKREKKYLIITLIMGLALTVALAKLGNDYFRDDSLGELSLRQAFMPMPVPEMQIASEKLILLRATESGLKKRLDRLGRQPEAEVLERLALDSEKLAKSYMSYGKYDLARKYFELAIKLFNKSDHSISSESYPVTFARLQIGNCFFAAGDYSRAIPYYKEGIKTMTLMRGSSRDYSDISESLIYKASSEYAAGKLEDATRTYKRLLRAIPESDIRPGGAKLGLIYSQLADCYRLKEDYAAAVKFYKKAIKSYETSPTLRTTGDTIAYQRYLVSKYLEAYCQYKFRRFDRAMVSYESVLPDLKNLEGERRELKIKALAQYADILWQKGSLARSVEMSMKARELKRLDY